MMNEKKSYIEKISEFKKKIDQRRSKISNETDYKKRKKLEIRNEIDSLNIRIENYKNFINTHL